MGVGGSYLAKGIASEAAMSDLKTIDIGLIGNEGHAYYVLDGIPKVEGARLVAYAKGDPNEDVSWLRSSSGITGQIKVFDSYDEMLDKVHLTVAVVCLPYYRNAAACLAAARRGIHVISEKPVATTEADLDALEKVVKESGVRFTAMLAMRLIPAYLCIHRAVAAGAVGEPILATAQKSYKWDRRPDFYRKRETYGGSFLWVGIHAVDYVRFTTGLEYTHVMGHHGNKAHPDYPGCEDHGAMVFRFENGGTADIHMDYLRPSKAPTHGDDRLRIAGSEGVIEIKDFSRRVELIAGNKEPRDLDLPESRDFFVDFVAELRGEGKHIIGPDEAIRVTRVCIKAREAADTGRAIAL
jgi:predicted dehydrogenase